MSAKASAFFCWRFCFECADETSQMMICFPPHVLPRAAATAANKRSSCPFSCSCPSPHPPPFPLPHPESVDDSGLDDFDKARVDADGPVDLRRQQQQPVLLGYLECNGPKGHPHEASRQQEAVGFQVAASHVLPEPGPDLAVAVAGGVCSRAEARREAGHEGRVRVAEVREAQVEQKRGEAGAAQRGGHEGRLKGLDREEVVLGEPHLASGAGGAGVGAWGAWGRVARFKGQIDPKKTRGAE